MGDIHQADTCSSWSFEAVIENGLVTFLLEKHSKDRACNAAANDNDFVAWYRVHPVLRVINGDELWQLMPG